ncbi:MAG: DUF2934 domain-containing protein [Acetobacteraceae bacterium]|nr:DUF2934 domain-containing protein [Acetobacteraceae bacterium]
MDSVEQQIRNRAYQIWEEEGRPHGREHEHWERARSDVLAAQKTRAATPPASLKKATGKPSESSAKPKRAKSSKKSSEDRPRL